MTSHWDIMKTGTMAAKVAAIRKRNAETMTAAREYAEQEGTDPDDEAWGEDVEIRELLAVIDHIAGLAHQIYDLGAEA